MAGRVIEAQIRHMSHGLLIRRVSLGTVHQAEIYLALSVPIDEIDVWDRLRDQSSGVERARSQVEGATRPVLGAGFVLVEKALRAPTLTCPPRLPFVKTGRYR